MRFRKMRALSICGTGRVAAAALSLWLAVPSSYGGSGDETNEIISNDMRLLCGGGDTLWVANRNNQGWGVNYTTNQGESWWGYRLGISEDLYDIAFGRGTFAAILNPRDISTYPWKPARIWHYTFSAGGNKSGAFEISWPDTLFKADSSVATSAVDAVVADNDFYFACQNGGIVRWNPKINKLQGFIPGGRKPFEPKTFMPDTNGYPLYGKAAANVFAVDRFQSGAKAKILAVTGPRLWLFDPAGESWDSLGIVPRLADSTLSFGRFGHAFVNNASGDPILYAYIRYVKNGGTDSLLSLFRYRAGAARWTLAIKEAPRIVTPAVRGFLYAVSGANRITAYRDSPSDTVPAPEEGLAPVITDDAFYRRLTVHKNIDRPDSINDMLFVSTSDSSGHFYIAAYASNLASDGLYLSNHEIPSVSSADFKLVRRARVIKSGLKETYAKPGIISDDYWNPNRSAAIFVYKLTADARVTIRVYDFSMQLVKTVVENEPRKAAPASGQSTDVKKDVWDGTTSSGRRVAPGVYYYKITASTGERSFGKIVVAKGPGN